MTRLQREEQAEKMVVWQPAKLQPDGLRLMHLGDVTEVIDVNPLALNAITGQVTVFAGLPDQVQERI